MTDSERDRLARQLQEEAGLHWAGSPSARRSVASLLDRAAQAIAQERAARERADLAREMEERDG
jgi:hypothetical protein